MSLVPSVKLKLGRKTYTLVEDFNALAVHEELTGISAFDPKANFEVDDKGDIRFEDHEVDGEKIKVPIPRRETAVGMRARLYSLLRREHPDVTLEEVGAMLHAGNIEAVQTAFQDLLLTQLPEGEGKKGSPPAKRKKPNTSPGKTSGPSPSSNSD